MVNHRFIIIMIMSIKMKNQEDCCSPWFYHTKRALRLLNKQDKLELWFVRDDMMLSTTSFVILFCTNLNDWIIEIGRFAIN